MITRQLIRRFTTSAVRKSDHEGDGIPGHNIPFPIKNKIMLTMIFCAFFGSGFTLPFVAVRYNMLK